MNAQALLPSNPPLPGGAGNPRIVVDALIRQIQDRFPGIVLGAVVSAAVVKQVVEVVKNNISAILSGVLTTAGLVVLYQSLALVLVNLLGFSATGVVGGALGL